MGKYVGIIAAMPEEMEAIKSKMINTKEVDIFNLKFFEGKIKNQEIYELNFVKCKIKDKICVLVKSGVGKVNAARTTQIMIDKFDIDYIINIGSAGSINDDVEYGDIVIGKYVLQHDFDITAFGHEKGYISNIGVKLESNTKLIKRCEYVIKNMKENNYKCVIGTIATGDIFCTSRKMKDKIRTKFDADCVEMEGAAIAQTAYLSDTPFIIIRSISDSPNEENQIDFNKYLKMAADRCAIFIENLMGAN